MVVILRETAYEEWLTASPEQSMDFMQPYPATGLIATGALTP